MAKRLRIALFVFCGLVILAGVSALVVWQSVKQVPAFYQIAVALDEDQRLEASDQCLRQATILAGDLQRSGRWQSVFTADQINGWLAVDLPKYFPDALPEEFADPRVDIHDGLATLACTIRQNGQSTVVSLSFDVYISDPNVIALRLRGVRAGLLPVPLSMVLKGISEAAENFDLALEWRQSHGDPVALLTFSQGEKASTPLHLDVIELRDGEVYMAGQASPGDDKLVEDVKDETTDPFSDVEDEALSTQARAESEANENRQR